MKSTSLNDSYLRKLQARPNEFLVTDDIAQPTRHGNLSLCLRVFPTGRKLWAMRARRAARPVRTLGVFAPGKDEHLSLEDARRLLAEVAQQLEVDATTDHPDLDQALDQIVHRLSRTREEMPCGGTLKTRVQTQAAALVQTLPSSPPVSVTLAPGKASPPMVAPNFSTSWQIVLSPTTHSVASPAVMPVSLSTVVNRAPMHAVAVAPALERLTTDSVIDVQARVDDLSSTLKDLLDTYIRQLKDAGKTGSARDYSSLFKRRVLKPHPELAHRPARLIVPSDIVMLVRDTLKAPRKTRNRSASASHLDEKAAQALPMKREADKLRAMLKGAFNASLRNHLDPNIFRDDIKAPQIDFNPAESVVPVKGAIESRHRVLSADEMAAFVMRLGTGGTLAAQALESCIWLGGQRVAQILRAEVGNYDAHSRTLLIFDGKGRRETPRPHLLPVRGRAAELLELMATRAQQFRPVKSHLLFTTTGRLPLDGQTVSDLLGDIKSELMAQGHVKLDFDVRDLRRTAETVLASRGVSKDDRGHLLSHGLGGVQNVHYDRYDHFNEKVRAIELWHAWLEEAVRNFLRHHGDVISSGRPARAPKSPEASLVPSHLVQISNCPTAGDSAVLKTPASETP